MTSSSINAGFWKTPNHKEQGEKVALDKASSFFDNATRVFRTTESEKRIYQGVSSRINVFEKSLVIKLTDIEKSLALGVKRRKNTSPGGKLGGGILSIIKTILGMVISKGGKALKAVSGLALKPLAKLASPIAGLLKKGAPKVMGLLGGVGKLAGGIAGPAFMALNWYDIAKDPSSSLLGKIWEYGSNALSGGGAGAIAGTAVTGPVGTVVGAIGGAAVGLFGTFVARNWDSVKDWWDDLSDNVSNVAVDVFHNVYNKGNAVVEKVVSTNKMLIEGVKFAATWLITKYGEIKKNITESLDHMLDSSGVNDLMDWFSKFFSRVGSKVGKFFGMSGGGSAGGGFSGGPSGGDSGAASSPPGSSKPSVTFRSSPIQTSPESPSLQGPSSPTGAMPPLQIGKDGPRFGLTPSGIEKSNQGVAPNLGGVVPPDVKGGKSLPSMAGEARVDTPVENSPSGADGKGIEKGPSRFKEDTSYIASRIKAAYPHLQSSQCVALAKAFTGDYRNTPEWRRGVSAKNDLPPGTPLATFFDRNFQPSNKYDGGRGGVAGANKDHAMILNKWLYDKNGNRIGAEVWQQFRGKNPHLRAYYYGDKRGGEQDLGNYYSIDDSSGKPIGAPETNPMWNYNKDMRKPNPNIEPPAKKEPDIPAPVVKTRPKDTPGKTKEEKDAEAKKFYQENFGTGSKGPSKIKDPVPANAPEINSKPSKPPPVSNAKPESPSKIQDRKPEARIEDSKLYLDRKGIRLFTPKELA